MEPITDEQIHHLNQTLHRLLNTTFTETLEIKDQDAFDKVFGIERFPDGSFKPPKPYATWESYHEDVYRMCSQIAKSPGVEAVIYNKEDGELRIYGTDHGVWIGGVPEFQRHYEAARRPAPEDAPDAE